MGNKKKPKNPPRKEKGKDVWKKRKKQAKRRNSQTQKEDEEEIKAKEGRLGFFGKTKKAREPEGGCWGGGGGVMGGMNKRQQEGGSNNRGDGDVSIRDLDEKKNCVEKGGIVKRARGTRSPPSRVQRRKRGNTDSKQFLNPKDLGHVQWKRASE